MHKQDNRGRVKGMEKESAGAISSGNGRQTKERRGYARWYIAYFLLAAFDILTVTGSLLLHLQLLSVYEESVATNRLWAEQLESYVELESMIAAANASGNDIFASHDPEFEAARHEKAMAAYEEKMGEVRNAVRATTHLAPESDWLALIDEIDRKVVAMSALTRQIINLFAGGDVSEAGGRMARMDRVYADISQTVNRLEGELQEVQRVSLQHQLELAQDMRSLEYVIGGLIALMVLGVAIYGHRLSRQLMRHERERDEQLEALEASERRFRGLAEGSIQGIAVHRNSQPLFLNNAWQHMHGFTDLNAAVRVNYLGELVAPEDREKVRANHRKLEQGELDSQRYEYQALRQDGSRLWLECVERVVPWRGTTAIQSTVIDITERKQAEQNLLSAMEEARQATATRTRFFAAASHDLRQPLHAIALYLPLIEKRVATVEGREMVASVRNSCDSMRALLDSLLDISKLDAGVIKPEIREVPIIDIIDQLAMEFAPVAASKGIDLRIVPVDYRVMSDAGLLQRILRNLLSNALRYTEKGRVLIGARRRGNEIRIEVWDTGCGIPESEQPKIFEEFYQAANSSHERSNGLGLGLAIIDRLVRLLGHRITVRSEPGKGSSFCVCADQAPASAERRPRRQQPDVTVDMRGLLAILVDDDSAVLAGTRSILEEWGTEVLEADSSSAAEERVALDGRIPHIICADLRLRGEDCGLEAVRRIRRVVGQPIPAVIITAETDPERLQRIAGQNLMVAHKPVKPEELRRIIAAILLPDASGSGKAEVSVREPQIS